MNPQLDAVKNKALEINASVNKLATEQGKATQSFDSAGQRTMSTDIPVSAVDNSAPAVNIPQPNITVPPASSVISSGVPIMEADTAQKQAAVDSLQTEVGTAEARYRELMGLVGQKSAVNAQLRQEKGVTQASELVSSLVNSLRTQQANLADNDDIFEDSVQMSRLQASGMDITKRTFGAMETEMRLNRAIDRRSQMAGIRATQASYYVATDNLEAAKAEVKEALDLIYDPIEQELQMESFFLQRNDARLSDARKELATAKGREIEFKLGEIAEAKGLVSMAVQSGYASPEDITRMNELSGNPEAQREMAQGIVAKGAARDRQLRESQLNTSLNSSRMGARKAAIELCLAGDTQTCNEIGFTPPSGMSTEEAIAFDLQRVKVDTMLDAAKNLNSFGIGKTLSIGPKKTLIAGLGMTGGGVLAGAGLGAAGGSVVPGIGTLVGGAIGGLAGGFTGAKNTYSAVVEREKFIAELEYLITSSGFEELIALKGRGATFGALTERERDTIFQSANQLNASYDFEGRRVRGDIESFERNLKTFQELLVTNLERSATNSTLSPTDQAFINSLYTQ